MLDIDLCHFNRTLKAIAAKRAFATKVGIMLLPHWHRGGFRSGKFAAIVSVTTLQFEFSQIQHCSS
jgi:hypothetical protein